MRLEEGVDALDKHGRGHRQRVGARRVEHGMGAVAVAGCVTPEQGVGQF
jgi:hypothetical protein